MLDSNQNAAGVATESTTPFLRGPDPIVSAGDAQTVRQQMQDQCEREAELWSIVLLAFLLCGVAFASLLIPRIVWGLETVAVSSRFLPQLTVGFIILSSLFNVYVTRQYRILRLARAELIAQLVRAQSELAQSFVDPLTQVFSRRQMKSLIIRETRRVDRSGGTFALLMVDVNDFKLVNNKFGHLEGDRFLQRVADVLKQSFRQSDTIIRYGGDEFLVVMPDTDEHNAHIAANRLMLAVAAWNQAHGSNRCTMALSCGIACYTQGTAIEEVLGLADQRMYSHKRFGERNGTIC